MSVKGKVNLIACGSVIVLVAVLSACSPKAAKSSGSSAAQAAGGSQPADAASSGQAAKGTVAPASDFKYDLTKNGKGIVILQYTGKGGNVIVPNEIEGVPVVQLGGPSGATAAGREIFNHGFEGTKVTGVVLPDSIIMDFESVEYYEYYLVYGGEFINGFKDTPLQSITFPKGVTFIPKFFFENCKSLKSIAIPDTVKKIEEYAFRGSGLTDIIIPEGVDTILDFAFSDCKDLKSVTLPESINIIGQSAFAGCSNLETVKLPSHTINYAVDSFAFYGCTKLNIAARKAINDSGYYGTFSD